MLGDFKLKHLDLFSGIGGFALAAQWAGIETVAFCEIDDFACKVLNKNFPCIPVHRDIRELDGSLYAGIDLITGGYPCQPFSTAGKRKGADDPRHLWPEMFRVIKQSRPSWIVCENVEEELPRFLERGITIAGWLVGGKNIRAEHKAGVIEQTMFKESEPFLDKINGSRRFAWSFAEDVEGVYKEEEAWFEMHFSLPKGSYATVIIEELIKVSL